ncbi:DUF6153 family protein [Streptomyces sp. NPDC079141]|uniref:DUF6153 family protein n=1 Tax=Streptomyces sp. NPDC079141 TaxID=3155056 RepID=UPI0034260559
MTAPAQLRPASSPLGRWRVLLVLGLLAGLFGMHALAPGSTGAVGGHHSPAASAHVGMAMGHGEYDEYVCHGDADTGGHAQHADATCASGAVGAGPVFASPPGDPLGAVPVVDRAPGAFLAAPDGGRAPPTLAELQLLRI